MRIIIATHSYMGEGIKSAVNMLSSNKNITTMSAYINSDNFEEEFEKELGKIQEKVVIVLTDLLGGSVNQVVMKYRGSHDLKIISGINLYFVLKLLQIDDESNIDSKIKECIEESREQIIYINDLIRKRKEKTNV